jgi:hypothetical protein
VCVCKENRLADSMGDNKSTTDSNMDEEENELNRLENVEPEMIKVCEKIIVQLEDFKVKIFPWVCCKEKN